MSTDRDPVFISRKSRPASSSWPAYIALILSLGVSVLIWWLAGKQVEDKTAALFEQQKSIIVNRLTKNSDQMVDVLRSFQEFYAGNVEVVSDMFVLFAQVPARTYSGIRSITYSPLVTHQNKTIIERYAWNLGYTNWSIKPAGQRDLYLPGFYSVPEKKGKELQGFDFLSLNSVQNAYAIARDSGTIVATSIVELPSDSQKVFFYIAPIFKHGSNPNSVEARKQSINGVIVLTIPAESFISTAITAPGDSVQLNTTVYDQEKKPESIILEQVPVSTPKMSRDYNLDLASHRWILSISTSAGFGKEISTAFPLIALSAGVVISFLLFGFLLSLFSSRRRALDLADRMTRSQRRIVDSSRDMISIIGFDGIWKNMNYASIEALGYEPDDLIGKLHIDLVYRADVQLVRDALANAPDEKPITLEARYIDKHGDIQWISWSITSSRIDKLLYLIGRNITAKKLHDIEIRAKNRQLDLAGLIADHENERQEAHVRSQSLRLRTEMTGILGFLDLVLNDNELDANDREEFIRTARESASSLLDIPIKMSEMSFVHISDIAFVPNLVGLSELHDELIKEIAVTIPDADIHINEAPKDNAFVSIDIARFKQSILSLIRHMNAYQKMPGVGLRTLPDIENERVDICLPFPGIDSAPPAFFEVLLAKDRSTMLKDDEHYEIGFARLLIELLDGRLSIEDMDGLVVLKVSIPLMPW
jgi:PAS domain S-box-containing protein